MGEGHGTTYKGMTIHAPKRWHAVTGKGLCAIMWFWVFYRAKQDGPVVLGWRHPWEGHEDHGHGHGHGHDHDHNHEIQRKLESEGDNFDISSLQQ